MYVELHCHSAFSFLDGASLPDELVPAALALGYETVALTDHNSVSGSMEFAVSARALGLRPIHGAEIDLDDGRHLTLLVQDARGWSNLCRILTRAHAHTRDGRPGAPPTDPAIPLETVLGHAEGLVCLSGCALRGVHDEPTLRRLLDAFGPERLRVELQRPFLRDDRARNRRLGDLARRLGVACVATGNVHAHARSRAPLQDAFVAVRLHTTLDASEPQRRGNFSHVMASPEAMAARFAEHPEAVAETARLADRLRFDLRQRPRLPLSGRRGRRSDAHARRAVRRPSARALRHGAGRHPGAGERAPGGGDADHRLAGPARLLPAAPRHAGAGPRGGGGGARTRERAGAAAAGAGPRLERVLDRLLPHRALARGPDRQRAADRALPQRGADLAARHRPGLPARHPREADPARARALRPRALGAGGGLPHLPGPRRDPGAGQGAGAAAGGDRAGGPGQRGVGRARGGPRHRRHPTASRRPERPVGVAGAAGGRGPRPAAPPVPALRAA